jgi:hypothetical protein
VVPDELLDAVAASLRQRIGPAVGEPFARTQAFMAAVILEKLAGQLRAASASPVDDRLAVVADLRSALGATAPPRLGVALGDLEAVAGEGDDRPAWRALIEALYAEREALGSESFDRLLGPVRQALRARLDRTLVYAS